MRAGSPWNATRSGASSSQRCTTLSSGNRSRNTASMAVQRLGRGALLGNEIKVAATPVLVGHVLRRVAEQPDREPPALPVRRAHPRERIVERVGRLVEVPRLQPPFDSGRIVLDA